MKINQELVIKQVQRQHQGLSQKHIQRQATIWDIRNSEEDAYVPSELKGIVSTYEAVEENALLGRFHDNYMEELFSETSSQQSASNYVEKNDFFYAGYGQAYDGHTVAPAQRAGLRTVCLEISPKTCTKAEVDLANQYVKIPVCGMAYPEPLVIQGEIRSFLINPEVYEYDTQSIKVIAFCRTLTCLSGVSAKIVLECVGDLFSEQKDPEKSKRLVITSAMRDHNPHRKGKTSKLYTIDEIVSRVKKGAGCAVEAVNLDQHIYFDQVYTAMTLKCT